LSPICAALLAPPSSFGQFFHRRQGHEAGVAKILDFNLLDYGKMILNGASAVRSGLTA
jgi:hypothetical protein